MLVEPFLTSFQYGSNQLKTLEVTYMPESRGRQSPLVVLLGKREVWREKTRFIEKNGFSLSTKFTSFSKLTPPKVLGILLTPNRINNFIRKAQSWLSG